jgi:hypothetical protein
MPDALHTDHIQTLPLSAGGWMAEEDDIDGTDRTGSMVSFLNVLTGAARPKFVAFDCFRASSERDGGAIPIK